MHPPDWCPGMPEPGCHGPLNAARSAADEKMGGWVGGAKRRRGTMADVGWFTKLVLTGCRCVYSTRDLV